MESIFKVKFNLLTLFVVFLLHNWLCEGMKLYGQASLVMQTELEPDSLSEDSWSEETYYRIGILRLQRWIKDNMAALDDPILSKEIARFLKEADSFARVNDFFMANVWLETIWDLLERGNEIAEPKLETDFDDIGELGTITDAEPAKEFTWSQEVITGVDIWRQEFNFTFLRGDSTYLEGNGNPFTGVRFNFDYESENRTSLQALAFFKYSRDYLSGEANFRYSGYSGTASRWKVENRFEGTSFHRDFDLKYVQNLVLLGLSQRLGPLSLEFQDDFLIRRYTDTDSTYPNYYDNKLSAFTKVNLGLGSLVGVGYRNIQRVHPDFAINDYQENLFEITWLQSIGRHFNFSLENELRFRDYMNVPSDHFFQDFWENYFLGEIDVGFTSHLGTELRGSVTKREYQFVSANSLPDFLYWEIEPEIYFKIGSNWRIGTGFHYGSETHQKLLTRVSAIDAESAFSISFEDYYTYGPILSIDFFEINGVMFSLRESFLLRRYPNTPTQNVQQFNLYSDRNTNSILLFLSWTISSHWRLNILANMDDDRSLKDDSGDSQNTLLGFEMGYSF